MAPVTRAQERGGRGRTVGTRAPTRRGDGKPETVKETTTTSVARGGGGKRKARKRDRLSPKSVVDVPMVSTEDFQDDDVYYDSPDSYPDDDAVYYDDPPRSYPDRKATMDKCYEMKRETESNSKTKFEALETFLRRKKEGLTYRSAIDQLINGTLHPTLKNVIIKKICEYVEWSIEHNRKILPTLLWHVEHWDDEVIRLVVGLVNNLRNVVLIIPGLEAISAISDSILSLELEESSHAKLVQVMRDLVSKMDVSLLFMHEKMKVWANRPTPLIDTRHSREMVRSSIGLKSLRR